MTDKKSKKGDITRRGFLKTAGAAAVAAGGLITAPRITRAATNERQSEKKWDRLFLFDQASELPGHPYGSFDFTHMFTLQGDVYPGTNMTGANMTTATWYREPIPDWQVYRPQVHNDDVIMGFFGCNTADPFELGAEVEIYIEGKPYSFKRSCLLYLPQGVEHGPWNIKQIDRPIFVMTMHGLPNPVTWHGFSAKDPKWSKYPEFPGREYLKVVNMEDISPEAITPEKYKHQGPPIKKEEKVDYWKNFIFDPVPGLGHQAGSADFTHMFDLHPNIIPGSNETFCAMFRGPLPFWQRYRPHIHADNEILCYFGMDPDDPFDLGAEVEIYIEDEPYTFDRSCILYMPAGVQHIPWRIKNVKGKGFFAMYTHGASVTGRTMGRTDRDQRWSAYPWMEF